MPAAASACSALIHPARRRLLTCLLALCHGAQAEALVEAPATPPAETDLATQVLAAINLHRQQHGLATLRPADDLWAIAHDKSLDMAQRRQLSHAGFDRRFARATGQLCVENLAVGPAKPQLLVNAWRASPDHARNLIEPRLRRGAVAVVDGYITLFACD